MRLFTCSGQPAAPKRIVRLEAVCLEGPQHLLPAGEGRGRLGTMHVLMGLLEGEHTLSAFRQGVERRFHEGLEERVRSVRPAPEFGVELHADEERVPLELHDLDQIAVRRDAAGNQARLRKLVAVGVIDLEPVTMTQRVHLAGMATRLPSGEMPLATRPASASWSRYALFTSKRWR